MWPRFDKEDFKIVGHYLGTLVLMMGMTMIIPLIAAVMCGEVSAAYDFLLGLGVCLTVGNGMRHLRVRPGSLTRQQALLVVGLSWIVLALVSAVPMYASGSFPNFSEAVFDSISALTTTGTSLCEDFDHLPISHQLWRIIMTLMGGQGVIVVALSLGFFGRGGSIGAAYKAEGRMDQVLPNVIDTARFIWVVASSMIVLGTIIGSIICATLGMNPAEAIYNGFFLTVSAYDTGGNLPHSSSIIYYHSVTLEIFCLLFMSLGIINFVIYSELLSGQARKIFHNMEVRTIVIWVSIMTAVLVAVLVKSDCFSTFPEVLRRGMFMVVSVMTTTGMQTIYSDQLGVAFSAGVMMILMIVMIVGGSSGSTSGGIKAFRLGIIITWMKDVLVHTLMPRSAVVRSRYHQFGDRSLTSDVAMRAMIIFLLYTFTAILGGMIGIMYGYDAVSSLFESVACVSNTGLSTGIISMGLPAGLKLTYALEMYLGRLEFIALLATIAGLFHSFIPRRRAKHAQSARISVNSSQDSRPDDDDAGRGSHRPTSGRHHRGGRSAGSFILAVLVSVSLVAGSLALGSRHASAAIYDDPEASSPYAVQQEGMEPSSSAAIMTTVSRLLASDGSIDGETVTFSAEAIGQPIRADSGHVWVNVLGDGELIGVYMTDEQAETITNWGKYCVKGTELQITGVFEQACDEHQGDLDVHVTSMSTISSGGVLPETINPSELAAALVLIGVGGALWIAYTIRRRAQL